jgi:hypothetical protein
MRAIALILVYLSSAVVSVAILVFALSRFDWSVVPLGAIGLCSWIAISAVRDIAIRPRDPAECGAAGSPMHPSGTAVEQRV